MAIIKVNPDGTSNAKVGDWVVTGGGVFEKTATGSVQVRNASGENILKDLVGSASTKSSAVVDAAYNLLTRGSVSSNKTTGAATVVTPVVKTPGTNVIDEVLNNTQVFDSATNYDSFTTPDYSTSGSGGSSFDFSSIFGYAIVGLVLIVIIDKFMGGGK